MSDRYKGAILSPTAPTVIPQSAGGVYTLSQQLQYQGQGVWPQAVNNPLTNSLRFRQSATAWLSRTPSVSGSGTTFTWSGWIKRGLLGGSNVLTVFTAGTADAALGALYFDNSTNKLSFLHYNGAYNWNIVGTPAYRDPSAWYHVVAVVNTTQATASNRIRLYVNGVEITAFDTASYPTQNYSSPFFNQSGIAQFIGRWGTWNAGNIFDGYMAEINFIDGQALTPSSFGTTDAYGIWQPIPYTGTYGTNGFYLPFTNTTSTATLGNDFSGNSNTWTVNNISLTAGSTYDSMKDVPTNTNSNTANYAVMNPLDKASNMSVVSGNLSTTETGGVAYGVVRGTVGISSGKWYWEATVVGVTNSSGSAGRANIGIQTSQGSLTNYIGSDAYGWMYNFDGLKLNNGSSASYGAAYVTNDVIGIALDMDAGTLTFYKNNTSQGTAYSSLTGTMFPSFSAQSVGNTSGWNINFGQRPFSYTPPSGFYPLNTYNLPTPTILAGNQYMNVVTWTGTGTNSGRSITGVGFQPDFVWGKPRSLAYTHSLSDAVRGANKRLSSNSTSAEDTNFQYGYTSSFDVDGFTTTSGSSSNENWNTTNETFVAWNWKASNAAGVSNTQGTITSTVSANTTAGFSIVTYTGTGANATVGHGLGVAPSMVIVKRRNTAGNSWRVYHLSLTSAAYSVELNTTAAQALTADVWNSTAPTSTVFNIGTGSDVNTNTSTYVAYCFAPVAGYSAFGSYTGNGSSDGTFVYTGFRPRWILLKESSGSTGDWKLFDTARDTYNVAGNILFPNLSNAESTGNTGIDILSNGFKCRNASLANLNNVTYIYACFAENPFKIARGR